MLFILDKSLNVVDNLDNVGELGSITPVFEDEYTQDLATGSETYSFKTLANSRQSQHLVVGNSIAFMYKKEYKLFTIVQIEEEHTQEFVKTVYCEMSGLELANEIIRPKVYNGVSASTFLRTILSDTDWTVGIVDMSLTDSFDFDITDYKSVYSLIQEYLVGKCGVEVSFTVDIKANRIKAKKVNIFRKRGKEKGFRFSYDSNISSIVRTVDTTDLATCLIGIGNNNITFAEVEGENKPLGQDFIENPVAYRIWNKNGSHILGVSKHDTDSPHELLRLTREELIKRGEPKVKYELKTELLGTDEIEIGDTVYITDNEFNPPIRLEGRVSQLKTSFTDPTTNETILSNFKEKGSNIVDEMRQAIESRFPIGGSDIKDGAIDGDKLHNGQIITGTHLFANSITADKIQADSITTDHLQANSITSDKLTTGELITNSAQIGTAIIGTTHIKDGAIDTVKINDGAITSVKIGDSQIGTAQIKDLQVTVAKIQNAFVDDLVARQGKFQSAHIGVLTSNNIDANTIKAEHISSNVIDAINMSVSGTIDASKLNVNDIVDDNIDASKITTGTIDANRITGSVINAINGSFESATINSAKIGSLDASKITTGSLSADRISGSVINAINMSVSGKIKADRIDVDSIKVNNIDANAIVSGTIDANRISGSVVQAISLSSDKISANNINVDGLKVGGANILDGSITSAKIEKGQINNAHIDKAFIADGYVKNLSASVITSGTLDASKITVRNLNADSITTGSITVQGDNLIRNTGWKENTDNWTLTDGWTYDNVTLFEGCPTLKYSKTGLTTDKWSSAFSEYIKVTVGETYILSCYFKCDNVSTLDSGNMKLQVDMYDAEGTRVDYPYTELSYTTSNQGTWVRGLLPFKVTNANVVKLRARFFTNKNGTYNIAKPMLSRGSVASIWKPHTNELISDGAIDNDKIKDETITSDKLVIDEIWASEGFISNFKAQNIDANQITTGKITGEYLDITGLIGFDALDTSISENFTASRDSEGNITKTWINGASIVTGSVSADKINTRGLIATNTVGETTFSIDDVTGNVTMSGLVKSNNYSDIRGQEKGYLLTQDGNAYLNDTIVRGSVMLPSSGITQDGGSNLIPFTDFSVNVKDNYSTFGKNFVVTVDTSQNTMSVVNNTLDVAEDGGLVTPKIIGGLKANNKYTLSFKAMNIYHVGNLDYIYVITNKTGVSNKKLDTVEVNTTGSWDKTQHITFTVAEDLPNAQILIGFRDIVIPSGSNKKGFQLKELRLTEGDEPSMWFENSPVRFYAGSDFDNRNQAPFRVLEDGSVIATKGDFGGTITGKLRIGNIYIEDTNTTEGSIDIKNNNEDATLVHLEEKNSYIKSNLNIGDFTDFDVANKNIEVTKGNVRFNGNNSKYFKFPNSTGVVYEMGYTSSTYGDYKHELWYTQGTLHHNAFGTKKDGVPDYRFCRDRGETQASVEVTGELKVTDKITMNNNIAIVARQDTGNSGFDYVVK